MQAFFMGEGYRKLRTTPIDFPILDLAAFAGGLTPVRGAHRLRAHGRETVTYVSNIDKYYLAYHMLVKQKAARMPSRPRPNRSPRPMRPARTSQES